MPFSNQIQIFCHRISAGIPCSRWFAYVSSDVFTLGDRFPLNDAQRCCARLKKMMLRKSHRGKCLLQQSVATMRCLAKHNQLSDTFPGNMQDKHSARNIGYRLMRRCTIDQLRDVYTGDRRAVFFASTSTECLDFTRVYYAESRTKRPSAVLRRACIFPPVPMPDFDTPM